MTLLVTALFRRPVADLNDVTRPLSAGPCERAKESNSEGQLGRSGPIGCDWQALTYPVSLIAA